MCPPLLIWTGKESQIYAPKSLKVFKYQKLMHAAQIYAPKSL